MIQVTLKDNSYNEMAFRFPEFDDAVGFIENVVSHSVGDVVVTIAHVKSTGVSGTNTCD